VIIVDLNQLSNTFRKEVYFIKQLGQKNTDLPPEYLFNIFLLDLNRYNVCAIMLWCRKFIRTK